MSSRILQEDTSLLLTEASEPIVNDNFISADGFSTDTPTVQTTLISQNHNISGDSLESTPAVSTSSITQNHNVLVNSVLTSSVVISSSGLTQAHVLASASTLTGSPTLSTTGLIQDYDLNPVNTLTGSSVVSPVDIVEDEKSDIANILLGSPVVSSTTSSQNHNLSATSLITSEPRVATADDPAYIAQRQAREIEQMFGGWPRRAYEVPDGRLVQAEREIEATFGDRVSVDRKAKSLIKFGKSAALSTSRETVWTVGGNETYVNANLIDSISSSSVLDTQEIYLECHTVTGSGRDQQFTFVTQTVNLNGQTRVLLPTPVARISRMYNNNGTNLAGAVYAYQNTAIVGGVPSDITKVHAKIQQGFQQNFKAATTFSNEDYYILTGGFGSVSNKQAAAVDFFLEIREPGKVFREVAAVSANSSGGAWQIELDPAVIIPKNCDIRVTCETGDQGATVYCSFKGYLAKVIG